MSRLHREIIGGGRMMERLTHKEFEGTECEPYVYGGIEYYGDSYGGKVINKLAEYEDAEEQGVLLRLPCHYNDTLYWVIDGVIRKVWFKGIRCDKGYMPQIIARYIVNLSAKEEPITKLENIGKTVFLTQEEAEQALAKMKEV